MFENGMANEAWSTSRLTPAAVTVGLVGSSGKGASRVEAKVLWWAEYRS